MKFSKILAILCFPSLLFFNQSVYGQGKTLSFSEDTKVAGESSNEVYQRAKQALSNSFSSSNLQLLELKEDENASIAGNSTVEFNTKDAQLRTVASGSISFSFEVEIMNGSASMTLSNFNHVPLNTRYSFGQLTTDEECPKKVGGTMKKSRINVWTELKETAKETAEALLKDFTSGMSKSVEGDAALSAQTIKKEIPSDIKTTGIIILKHELAEINEDPNASGIEKKKTRNKKMHNKLAEQANEKLEDVVRKYPYKYVIAESRSELAELKNQGYKYVLDCMAYDNMKTGNFKSSAKVQYFYELYVRDLSDNSRFILSDNFAERSVYDYNMMVLRILKGAIE